MINFWKVLDKWGEFSNFYRRSITIDGKGWKTSEHYFQAMKFLADATLPENPTILIRDHIANQEKPKDAANEGRRKDLPLRSDWEEIKDDIMRIAVAAKFRQHLDLQSLLLKTGDEVIVEDSPTDAYWGCGADRKGKNMLGIILQDLRDQLREEFTLSPTEFQEIFIMDNAKQVIENFEKILNHVRVLQSEVDYYREKYA